RKHQGKAPVAEQRELGAHPELSIRLFGPLDARLDGVPLSRLRSRKGEWLLALLALRYDRDVDRAWLAGTLWPESVESRALYYLRRELAGLRRALGPEATRLSSPTPHTLRLDLAGAAVDVIAFDESAARDDDSSLAEAVGLYRAPL